VTEREPEPRSPLLEAVAGGVAVAVALAAGELIAALLPGVTSPVVAVGTAVIELAPGWLERGGIALFGTANKPALNVGVVVVALAVGAVVGRTGSRRFWVAALDFVAFGVLGLAALLGFTSAPGLGAGVVIVGAVGVGVVALRWLLGAVPSAGDSVVAHDPDRRQFLRLAAAVGAVAVISAGAGRMLLQRVVPVGVDLPPPVEPAVAAPPDLPVRMLSPFATPNTEFFRIDTALIVPNLDAETWRLRIHGMTEREITISLDDLLAMPLVERWVTIACVSNEVGGDLVGNAAWTGVPLRDLLDQAGVADGATQIVGRSVDGWTAGFPTEVAYDGRDALVAVGMNGEPLPRRHGAPARLIVAGLYGYVSATKWLEEIELARWEDFDAYWVPRGWAKEGPVKIASRIDVPRAAETIEAGPNDIAGVAWAPAVGIARVEVTLDGHDWMEAEMGPSVGGHAWRQWRYRWDATPGTYDLGVRATGEDGEIQTSARTQPFPDGATGHHRVRVNVVETA
jgi:DMSO/TMAO reductase YedYZ molybdopterin-dependent catalytic subunit